jgi:hypothetical protein
MKNTVQHAFTNLRVERCFSRSKSCLERVRHQISRLETQSTKPLWGKGDHVVYRTHGRDARPYVHGVGANLVFALRAATRPTRVSARAIGKDHA